MDTSHFPTTPIALKIAIAVAIGMLVGLEREWSNKDVGIRTFAIVALLGMLSAVNEPERHNRYTRWGVSAGCGDECAQHVH